MWDSNIQLENNDKTILHYPLNIGAGCHDIWQMWTEFEQSLFQELMQIKSILKLFSSTKCILKIISVRCPLHHRLNELRSKLYHHNEYLDHYPTLL